MKRAVIVLLAALEAAVGCGILVESVALSHVVARDQTVGRVAHVVVSSGREIAWRLQTGLRRLA